MSRDGFDAFAEQGWMVLDLPDPRIVFAVRDRLLARLRALLAVDLDCLEQYHTVVDDEARHIDVLYDLATTFWQEQLGVEIVRCNLAPLQRLVGLDLHVQTYPYLRAARPHRPQDCSGLHRDTYYGASPYEVALFVPFSDVSAESALRVVSGSHVELDAAYPFTQHASVDVEVGSKKHRLGFPYAPRTLDPALIARAQPVPMGLGQALVFGLSLVHGTVENLSAGTRVSTDVRVVNSLAPVRWQRGVRADYYRPLCRSPVSLQAQRYLEINASADPSWSGSSA